MRFIPFLIIAALMVGCCINPKGDLYLIHAEHKYGFIDQQGKLVIKPIFMAAHEFSEGFAAARLHGSYGYLDAKGHWAIPPQFEYAEDFSEGIAVVYKSGEAFCIDTEGSPVVTGRFSYIGNFNRGRARVVSQSHKFGVIDRQGKLVVDTAYGYIWDFKYGHALVEGSNRPNADGTERLEKGVVNQQGDWIIPFGTVAEVQDAGPGLFILTYPRESWDTVKGYTRHSALVNVAGKVLYREKQEADAPSIYSEVSEGLLALMLLRPKSPEHDALHYMGYADLTGHLYIDDTSFTSVGDFSCGRAFVRHEDDTYSLIDAQGRYIKSHAYEQVHDKGFLNGLAFVKSKGKWGLIDIYGNYKIKPSYHGISREGLYKDYFFFQEVLDTNTHYAMYYGIANLEGRVLLEPSIDRFDNRGFRKGLLSCIIKGKHTYINALGKQVWQEPEPSKDLVYTNIDYKSSSCFSVYSPPHPLDLGGHSPSYNFPKTSASKHFTEPVLGVEVSAEGSDTMPVLVRAHKVWVYNRTRHKILFDAQDSRLPMRVQALHPSGDWRDIEFQPRSWCGNSYHTLQLNPNEYWELATPCYRGAYPTQLRIKLIYLDPSDTSTHLYGRRELAVYSKPYMGSVNLAQFWRTEPYIASNVMDPY